LTPSFYQKDDIISFYKYDEISELIKYKYERFGSRVFEILAKNSFFQFAKHFKYDNSVYAISIDDRIKKGYSHTAILCKYLSCSFKPLFSSLIATNNIKYAGKSLEFRLNNPRNFIYKGKKNIKAVLVDDIVTTKTTIKEAVDVLKKHGVEVLFSVVLADLRD